MFYGFILHFREISGFSYTIGDILKKIFEEVVFGFKSKKKKNSDKLKPSSVGSLGFGSSWSKYETKKKW